MKVGRDAREIDKYRDDIPQDHGTRDNQQTLVDPANLKSPHDCLYPWVRAGAGAILEHRNQVRYGGEVRSQACDKAKHL